MGEAKIKNIGRKVMKDKKGFEDEYVPRSWNNLFFLTRFNAKEFPVATI